MEKARQITDAMWDIRVGTKLGEWVGFYLGCNSDKIIGLEDFFGLRWLVGSAGGICFGVLGL
jgi:hypothetical protein